MARCTAVTGLSSNIVSFTTCDTSGGLAVSTSPTTYKVRLTPKAHADMPAPPGASYAVTGTVTSFTSTNAQSGTDSASATITIDNASPSNVAAASGSAGDGQVSLAWTNPGDADLDSIIILRAASTVADTPAEGTTYTTGTTIGSATVACVVASPGTTCTDTDVVNDTAYYYSIFTKDSRGNYAASGAVPTGSPFTPAFSGTPTTTVGSGADPAGTTVAPGSSNQYLDQFTLKTNIDTDSITTLTVTTANTTAITSMRVVSDDTATQYFDTVSVPAGDDWSFTGGTAIPATTSNVPYRILVAFKSHTDLAVGSYAVTAHVTAFTSTNAQSGSDGAGTVITVDNNPPASATATGGSAGDTQVALNWTTSASPDFSTSVMLRWAGASAGSEVPAPGADYTVDTAISTATVACVRSRDAASTAVSVADGSGTNGCSTVPLTNGQAYTYSVFQKDSYGNYDAGAAVGTFTPLLVPVTTLGSGTDSATATVEPGTADQVLDSLSLLTNIDGDTVTALTITTSSTATIASLKVLSTDLTIQYFATVVAPAGDSWSFTGGTPIPVTTSATEYQVVATLKNHADLAANSFAVTARVTSFASTNQQSGADTAGATVTVDNQPPADATWGTVTPGNGQVVLSWTNPADADFAEALVLRNTAAISDAPTAGATYTSPGTIGASDIMYVGSTQSLTDTSVTNGTHYYYKIFSRDTYKNYSAGIQTGPHTPNAPAPAPSGGGGGGGGYLIVPTPVPPSDTTPPSSPVLSAGLITPTSTELAWTAASDSVGVTGYLLYRDGALVTTLGARVFTYSDTGLSPHTTHTYHVDAFDAAGNAAPSNVLQLTLPSLISPIVPPAPTPVPTPVHAPAAPAPPPVPTLPSPSLPPAVAPAPAAARANPTANATKTSLRQ